jgi:prolipoprotein diacylglyceryltransferase
MYPNLYYAFKDLFGVAWKPLHFLNSFGFFVALAFFAAAYVLMKELQRKERASLLIASEIKVTIGEPASLAELLQNLLLGFLLGYKFVGLFLANAEDAADPQQFIFSLKGNWITGIVLGLGFAALKWWEKNKRKLVKPETRSLRIWPHDRVGDIVILAALFGFLGAKIFHNLENWDEFRKDPVGALLSFSGLTFYGGLICAATAIYFYARRHKINFKHLCDAAAPALMLSYAIGRIGCHVSGDGDWGILNSAYVNNESIGVTTADPSTFQAELLKNAAFYSTITGSSDPSQIRHLTVKAPAFLPDWLFAYSYPHNVLSEGIRINDCNELQYCNQLPLPVFPTPFYETLMGLALFVFLWSIRSKVRQPGMMFGIYLMVNGAERFLIEKIRVNTTYTIMGFHPTQAELIATLLFITGLILVLKWKSPRQA